MEQDDILVTVKQDPDVYTYEEWINQYSLPPQAFANDDYTGE